MGAVRGHARRHLHAPVVLLGSSNYSAQLAGALGLPFAFAHHFDMGGLEQAVAQYQRAFRPSPVLDRPHLIVTANVFVAGTQEEADHQAAPGRLMVHAIRTGRFEPLCSPEAAAGHPHLAAALAMPSNRIVGPTDVVVDRLDRLVEASGADEVMISSVAHDLAPRLTSLELLMAAWDHELGGTGA